MDLLGSWYAGKDISNCTLIIIFKLAFLLRQKRTKNKKAEDNESKIAVKVVDRNKDNCPSQNFIHLNFEASKKDKCAVSTYRTTIRNSKRKWRLQTTKFKEN